MPDFTTDAVSTHGLWQLFLSSTLAYSQRKLCWRLFRGRPCFSTWTPAWCWRSGQEAGNGREVQREMGGNSKKKKKIMVAKCKIKNTGSRKWFFPRISSVSEEFQNVCFKQFIFILFLVSVNEWKLSWIMWYLCNFFKCLILYLFYKT